MANLGTHSRNLAIQLALGISEPYNIIGIEWHCIVCVRGVDGRTDGRMDGWMDDWLID
jgi:hypothetical protein